MTGSRPARCESLERRVLLSGTPLYQPTPADVSRAKLEYQAAYAVDQVIAHALGLSYFDVPAGSALDVYVANHELAQGPSSETLWDAFEAWINLGADVAIEFSENARPWVPIFLQVAQLAQVAQDLAILKETLGKVAVENQRNLYRDARPYTSASDISNLAPADLLWDTTSGQPITKTDAGWLVRGTSYLIGFPTDVTPARLFACFDCEWRMAELNAQLQSEKANVFAPAFRQAVDRISAGWPVPIINVPQRTGTPTGPVTSVSIRFSEPVTGVDLSDFTFARAGGPNLLTAAQTVTTADGINYTISGMDGLTAASGHYVLGIDADRSDVNDGAGNPLAGDALGPVAVATPLVRGTGAADTYTVRQAAGGQATEVFENIPPGAFPTHVIPHAPADVLTFDLAAGDDTLTVISSPSPVRFDGGAGDNTLNVRGQTIDIRGGNGSAPHGTLTLNLQGGSAVIDSPLRLKSLNLSGGGRLDLRGNDLAVTQGTSTLDALLQAVNGYVKSGRSGGAWTGSGLSSSAAAADPANRTIGVAIDPARTGVIARLTLPGDANLDHSVDFNDLVALAQNYNTTGGMAFDKGDFNYDGNVDFNDLVLLAQRYNTTLAPPQPAPAAAARVAAGPLASRSTAVARGAGKVFSTTPVAVAIKPKVAVKPVRAAGRR